MTHAGTTDSDAGGVAHAAAAVSIILLSASADGAAPQHFHSYAGTVDVVAVADLKAVVSDGFAGSAAYQVRVPRNFPVPRSPQTSEFSCSPAKLVQKLAQSRVDWPTGSSQL